MNIQILLFILIAMILSPPISGVSTDALPSQQVVEINKNEINDEFSTITNYKISLI